jgi:hypothetical protein
MPTALGIVRSQGQSGKHMLALRFSPFDPERTSNKSPQTNGLCKAGMTNTDYVAPGSTLPVLTEQLMGTSKNSGRAEFVRV